MTDTSIVPAAASLPPGRSRRSQDPGVRLPRDGAARAGRLGRPTTPSAQHRQARRRRRVRLLRRSAVRQRSATLRPSADRLRQGSRSRVSRPCAASKVERRFGWDCHGLPAEIEAEKQLGITDKSEIDVMGLAEFNDVLQVIGAAIHRTSGATTSPVRRAGSTSTTTTRPSISTSWSRSCGRSSRCYDKGLIYQGFRVLPYSWYEQTPLSNQETRLDDAYKMRQDPAVTVDMPLRAPRLHRSTAPTR